jgi:hypothetical protein
MAEILSQGINLRKHQGVGESYGLRKRLLEKQQEQRNIATEIAIEAGVLKRCEYHGENKFCAPALDSLPIGSSFSVDLERGQNVV